MKKLLFILGILLIATTDAFCQYNADYLKKYWFYRFRLQNDFMLVGDCQGCSLPAEVRKSNNEHKLLK